MSGAMIDLRSDTVTVPDEGMRRAMAQAEVGDDVYGEDPTVNRLEARMADMLGKEAAVFVPSGTMANQIAIRIHTRPGDEVLCEQFAHICQFEAGAPAMLSGVTLRTIAGKRGILDAADFEGFESTGDLHRPRPKLVAIENTHNRGGGTVYPIDNITRIAAWARRHNLSLHLDGARLINAVVARGIDPQAWAKPFDTVSFCFSKGLGAPIGSVLVGSKDLISEARRVRKIFGGAMRQAGVLAAAALYALDNNVRRIEQDHANAKLLANALEQSGRFRLRAADVETNLVWFDADPAIGPAREVAGRFRDRGVLLGALGPTLMRMCTHLNVSARDAENVAGLIPEIAQTPAA